MERFISSDMITRDYLDRWLFEVRHIDSVASDPSVVIFGKQFKAPIATAALSHLNKFCRIEDGGDGMTLMAEGAKAAGLLCFAGMGNEEELERMINTGASVVKIIKTYRDRETVYKKIRHAEEHGALAVGIDIDHAFNRDRIYDFVEGEEIAPVSSEEIKQFAASTTLPFIVKGVLSVRDAVKCVNAGAGGIVISHHNGRMDCSVPPLMMLPEIRQAVGKEIPIFVDCSLQNGQDVYRCIAKGATACCIGRPIMGPLREEGAKGVCDTLTGIVRDFCYTMSMAGTDSVKKITEDVLHFKNW